MTATMLWFIGRDSREFNLVRRAIHGQPTTLLASPQNGILCCLSIMRPIEQQYELSLVLHLFWFQVKNKRSPPHGHFFVRQHTLLWNWSTFLMTDETFIFWSLWISIIYRDGLRGGPQVPWIWEGNTDVHVHSDHAYSDNLAIVTLLTGPKEHI